MFKLLNWQQFRYKIHFHKGRRVLARILTQMRPVHSCYQDDNHSFNWFGRVLKTFLMLVFVGVCATFLLKRFSTKEGTCSCTWMGTRFFFYLAYGCYADRHSESPMRHSVARREFFCSLKVKQKLLFWDWFEQYRERVIEAEQMILTTLNFELNVQHPYTPLTSVLDKLGLSETVLINLAWNLINEGLRSSLWLQFKPHHIAAGAAFLAAKFLNFDLACHQSIWLEFQTTPSILRDVVQQLMELF